MSPLDSSSVDDIGSFDDDLPPAFTEESGALVEEGAVSEEAAEEAGDVQTPAIAGRGGVVLEKPGANIYTVMLVISFIAIIIAITCLSLELGRYDWKIKAR